MFPKIPKLFAKFAQKSEGLSAKLFVAFNSRILAEMLAEFSVEISAEIPPTCFKHVFSIFGAGALRRAKNLKNC